LPSGSVFFDLDGTLIDSKLDLANSVNATLQRFSLERLDNETIYSFVGNGVRQLLVDTLKYHGKLDILDEFYAYFLNYYSEHLLDNTQPYPGVYSLLEKLSGAGLKLFVVTNKSIGFTRRILEGLRLGGFFVDVVGGDSFENKKPHPEPFFKLAAKHSVDLSNSLVVGDSENDIIAANSVGSKIAWASYGFRDRSILKDHRVDFIVNEPKEILPVAERLFF